MFFLEYRTIAQEKTQRVNYEITAPEIRLVGMNSEPLGIVSLRAALEMSDERIEELHDQGGEAGRTAALGGAVRCPYAPGTREADIWSYAFRNAFAREMGR